MKLHFNWQSGEILFKICHTFTMRQYLKSIYFLIYCNYLCINNYYI